MKKTYIGGSSKISDFGTATLKNAVLQGFSLRNRKSWLQNNRFWNQLIALCFAALVFSPGCDLSNDAFDDDGEFTSPYRSIVYEQWGSNNLSSNGVTAHACCGKSPADGSDGPASYAINGNAANFWHSNWGMTLATADGHVGDTTAFTDLAGNTTTLAEYIEANIPNGAHWITLDLGTVVPNLARLGYLRRPGGGNGAITSYEVYISGEDIGWDTSHATLVAKGRWTGKDDYVYAAFVPRAARYIQLRERFDSVTTSNYASAANIILGISDNVDVPTDLSWIMPVYAKGMAVLETLPRTSPDYRTLKEALDTCREIMSSDLAEFPVAMMSTADEACAAILVAIEKAAPSKKPPEVEL
jgi:hypothetical protein